MCGFQTTFLIFSTLFPPRLKKRLQNGFAFVFQDAAFDCRVFIQQRVGKQIDYAACRAGFGFCRAVDDAADAGLDDGGGAHGAGFERDVEVALVEAVVLKGGTCGGKGADFGVAADVVVVDAGVVGGGDDLIVGDNDRADRDFADAGGLFCLRQGGVHEGFHFRRRGENGDGRMAFDGLFQSGFVCLRQVLRLDTEQQGFELPKRAAGNGQSGGLEQQEGLDRTRVAQLFYTADAEGLQGG